MNKNGIRADIHEITGSVEISPGIGLADGIFDIVSSGSTLVSNNLREVEVVMKSEALLIGNWMTRSTTSSMTCSSVLRPYVLPRTRNT